MAATESPGEFLTIGDVVRRWKKPESTVRRDARTGALEGVEAPGTNGRTAWAIPLEAAVKKYGPEPTPEEEATDAALLVTVALQDLEEERDALLARLAEAEENAANYDRVAEALREAETDLRVAEARLEEKEKADETVALLRQMAPILTALAAQATQPEARPAMLETTTSTPRRWFWQRRPTTPDIS